MKKDSKKVHISLYQERQKYRLFKNDKNMWILDMTIGKEEKFYK